MKFPHWLGSGLHGTTKDFKVAVLSSGLGWNMERLMTAATLPSRLGIPSSFLNYRFDTAYDEMFGGPSTPREHYKALHRTLVGLPPEELRKSQQAADLTFLQEGITFTVYGS